jgi:tetratricopeptide (TPR) repeat protein
MPWFGGFVIDGGYMRSRWVFSVAVALILSTAALAQQSDRDRGIDLYRDGKFTEAISALEAAVASNANDRIAWVFLGGGYVHADDNERALSASRKSHEIKQPASPPTYDRTVKVTHKPQPRYPRSARMSGASGRILVAVEFRSDGKIGFTFALAPSMNDLVSPSLEAARAIEFEPAVKNGKPVTVINLVEYGYRIQ